MRNEYEKIWRKIERLNRQLNDFEYNDVDRVLQSEQIRRSRKKTR